jgi:hypothetical protein
VDQNLIIRSENLKQLEESWGCTTEVKCLPSMCKALNSIVSTTKKITRGLIGETLQDSGIGKDFLNKTPKAQEIIATTDKFINFCTIKEIINRAKRQPTKWKKMFPSYSFKRVLITKVLK